MGESSENRPPLQHQMLSNIRHIRQLFGYSQWQMAELMGVKQSIYNRFENGLYKGIDFLLIESFAYALGLTVEYVMSFHQIVQMDPAVNPMLIDQDNYIEYSEKHFSRETYVNRIESLKALCRHLLAKLKS